MCSIATELSLDLEIFSVHLRGISIPRPELNMSYRARSLVCSLSVLCDPYLHYYGELCQY